MNTIVIETALVLEQEAVVRKLESVEDYTHPNTKTIYKIGYFNSKGNRLKVIAGRTNQTNINAGIETERIIQHFSPTYLFFVGVAGGLKDVGIGDIVIGADVFGFERGKAKEEFLSRPQFGFSSYELEQSATAYSTSKEWVLKSKEILNNKFHDEISTFSGTIASGEKVVGSTKSIIHGYLKQNCSHALAVEMEGLGFLEACRPYPLIKTLLLRGISDLVDGKEDADSEGSQPYAVNNAVEFLFGLIDFLDVNQKAPISSKRNKLFEITTKLYPEGIKDKGIWSRSGGDLSLIQLYTTGKAQWIDALKMIENGGGGDIDFDSLIAEMKKDYPKNESWKEI
jgi:nucleoside phosphorylase